jgi:lipopolysaccharide transport system permease protein
MSKDEDFDLWLEAGRTEKNYWRDLWRFRELFYVLAWRDVSVRYKQTVVGVAWALIRPLITMIIMTVIFGKVAKLPSEGAAPYALMVFAAMLPWQFFAAALASSADSVVTNANLISKVYFPRLIVPAGAVVTAFIDFLVSFGLLVVMMIGYQFWPTLRILALPGFIVLAILAALGPGLFLTALSVRYRDFKHVLPFLVQFGIYVSPVGFSSSVIPEQWRLLYSLNPMVGVIDGFRWCLLGGESQIYWPGFFLSIAVTLSFCVLGVFYFRKTERTFADVI